MADFDIKSLNVTEFAQNPDRYGFHLVEIHPEESGLMPEEISGWVHIYARNGLNVVAAMGSHSSHICLYERGSWSDVSKDAPMFDITRVRSKEIGGFVYTGEPSDPIVPSKRHPSDAIIVICDNKAYSVGS
ncbi:MAG: hypothetical protein UT34_C0002G0083 [candidate division WS6 bacterium GW2011_GWF2_39_15]|uniref:Uncharacterized protein n=1 Tax=candidate division WS6 bacterium GW2011_GWF2_39_15 TaxID=1619100 RepID=A0A0G0MYF2_9BACT|nr:MAG: hypothetical protein UT34_C0002G0083 [candidate division WS6 bacterium GW2011_GWF2_39_15]